MTVTTSICDIFKDQLVKGNHNIGRDTFKIALFKEPIELDNTTTDFPTGDDITASGYVAGGEEITLSVTLSGTQTRVWADDVRWDQLIAQEIVGAMVYNESLSTDNAVLTISFDRHITVNSPLTLDFSHQPIYILS